MRSCAHGNSASHKYRHAQVHKTPVFGLLPRYVILPKDFEKGYKANVKKGDSEFAFYQ